MSIDLEQNRKLNLNTYEIRLDDNFIQNKTLLESFLFDCQCALFLLDISYPDSFILIKKLIKNIDMKKYHYLVKILIQNKFDLETDRKISISEIKNFLDNNQPFEHIEISLKNGHNIQELIKKINIAINETKTDLPLNFISECKEKKLDIGEIKYSFDFLLIGDSTVGKASLFNTYFKNQNEANKHYIGIDKEIKYVKVENDKYKINLWNKFGHETNSAFPVKFYRKSDGFLLLFDITNEKSFTNVSNWIKEIKECSDEPYIYLIGNKIDNPDRVITKEKAEELAESLGIIYFEISCKMNLNIQEVMARMIMECHKKYLNDEKYVFKLEPIRSNYEHHISKKTCV